MGVAFSPGTMRRACTTILLAIIACALHAPAAHALGYKLAHVLQGPVDDRSFGGALALDGTHLLVGSYAVHGGFGSEGSGAAYLFDAATGTLLRTFVSPTPSGAYFGDAVALAGSRVVVGEPYEGPANARTGAVWIFDADGNLLYGVPNPAPAVSQYFGSPLAADGDRVWVGAPYDTVQYRGTGTVHLVDATNGQVVETLGAPSSSDRSFGRALAPLGPELLVATGGHAYVVDAATGAVRLTLDEPPGPPGEDRYFGADVAVAGGLLAVGAHGQQVRDSRIYLYNPTSGALVRTLESPFHLHDVFGGTLAADGARLATGAPNYGTRDPSAVFVFDAPSGTLLATVMHPDLGAAQFGRTVALRGKDLFVGGNTGPVGSGEERGAVFHFVEACGDAVLDPCERCDDGNTANGDGCDANCRLESCGNGVLDAGEACDDGNAIDGDGCDSNCLATGCGDCVVTAGEACDDGNAVDGDGCDAGCVLTRCGNGITTAREQCDDANDVLGDGCTPDCRAESCGDGIVDAGESCDDGNVVDGDGCGAGCRLETPRRRWLKQAFQFYVGDFAVPAGSEVVVGPTALLASVHFDADETHAWLFDRDGRFVAQLDQGWAGPFATFGGDFLVGELFPGGTDPARIHRYDGATFARRATYDDPTPSTTDGFGRVVAAIGDKVLVRDAVEAAVYVYDGDSGALLHTLHEPPPGDPHAFGRKIVALGDRALIAGTEAVHLFDVDTGALVRTFTAPRRARGPFGRSFAALGDAVLVGGSGAAYLFDAATGAVRRVLTPPPGVRDPAFGDVTIAGDDVVVWGARGLYVFDGATLVLRHVIPNPPAVGPNSCLSGVMPAFDGHLVASDRCTDDGDDDTGTLYLFAHDDGRVLAEIPNPYHGYEDHFHATATYDTTILGRIENLDDGIMFGFRPCADGVLEPGEECDDGNRTSGDGCDLNCTVSRCGNGIAGGDEECDDGNGVADDGCESDCRRTPIVCDGGGALEHAQLVIRKAGARAGDESLTFTGVLTGASGHDANPVQTGVALVIEDATGTAILDLSARTAPIPPGGRGTGCAPGDGWRAAAGRFVYTNVSSALDAACTPGSARGLRRVFVDTTRAGGGVAFRMAVGPATLTAPSGAVTARLVLGGPAAGRAGACAERTLDCRPTATGATVVCR